MERLGTALFITLEYEEYDSIEKRAKFINKIKSHVTYKKAKEALIEIEEIIKDADGLM